jgi:hypothetical protein
MRNMQKQAKTSENKGKSYYVSGFDCTSTKTKSSIMGW